MSKTNVSLFSINPNAAISSISKALYFDFNFQNLKQAIIDNSINLIVVGPEIPLIDGVYDFIKSDNEICNTIVIGPSKKGAMLEGSKDFAKEFMLRHNIPTADYATFTSDNVKEAKAFLDERTPPYVIKANGLAAGKGVIITSDRAEAEATLDDILLGNQFGEAGSRVVIEQFMEGVEVSYFVVTDGDAYRILPSAKDYKRVGEGDTGLNTGGMGAVSPVPFVDAEFHTKTVNQIIIPTIKGLKEDEIPYNGFIFIGLMKVGSDPYVVEYNTRLGDPETEVVLPRIKSDLLHMFDSLGSGMLSEYDLQIDDRAATTVILTSGGYPDSYDKGLIISGLENKPDPKEGIVFHAGTKTSRGKVHTNGGRVIACTGLGANLERALQRSYKIAKNIDFSKKQYRKDIGQDVITSEE